MNHKHLPDALEPLGSIKKVDAPPYLFSKIEARLQAIGQLRVKPALAWATCLLVLALTCCPVFIIARQHRPPQGEAASFNYLLPNNSLYK